MTEILIGFCFLIMSGLVIAQQIYWSRVVSELTSKLMSKDYQEFAQAEAIKKPRIASVVSNDAAIDPIAQENAERANSFFLG